MRETSTENSHNGKIVLPKVFSFHHYLSLSVGYAIGLGWIVVPARMLLKGGPAGILIAVVVSCVCLYFIARCYAAQVSTHPTVGGEIVFALKSFGNGAAFLVFWLLTLGYLSYLLFYTSFSGVIFESLFPALQSDTLYVIAESSFRMSSIIPGLLIGAFVISINYMSTKIAIAAQSIMTALLIALVSIVAVVALINGDLSNMEPQFAGNGTLLESGKLVFIVVGMICWYIFGFSTIAQCAGECKDDATKQKLGTAIILSLVLVSIFYFVVHLFIIVIMPWSESARLGMPTAEALKLSMGYDWAMSTILVAGLLGIATTINACIICSVRSILAAVQAGFLPEWFGVVDQRTGAPRNAIVFIGIFVAIGPFLALAWLATDLGPISFVCAYIFTCAAALKHQKDQQNRGAYVMAIYLGIFVAAIMALSMFVPGSYYHIEWPHGYLFLTGCAIVGFLFYRWSLVDIRRR